MALDAVQVRDRRSAGQGQAQPRNRPEQRLISVVARSQTNTDGSWPTTLLNILFVQLQMQAS